MQEVSATYRVTRGFRAPFHGGSLLRGLLGRGLRRRGCAEATPCADTCRRLGGCVYARLFKPALPEPRPLHLPRDIHNAPARVLPLIPPPGAASLVPDDEVTVAARILGPLSRDEGQVVLGAMEALTELAVGRDGGRLELVSRTLGGARVIGLDAAAADSDHTALAVHLVTPASIERRKRLAVDLDFPSLVGAAASRWTTLCALHGTVSDEAVASMASLKTLARAVRTVDRRLQPLHWHRQSEDAETPEPMHGLLGTVRFDGPVGPLLPLLRAATLFHVGKLTGFGLGRIALEPGCSRGGATSW